MNNISHWYQPITKQEPWSEVTEDSLLEQQKGGVE